MRPVATPRAASAPSTSATLCAPLPQSASSMVPLEAAQRLQGLLAQGERVDDLHADALARADHGLQLVVRSGGQRPPRIHDHDARADLFDLFHVVGSVDNS